MTKITAGAKPARKCGAAGQTGASSIPQCWTRNKAPGIGMQTPFYVSLSSQVALDKRLTTIANNIANAGTVGYRASGVSFEAVLSKAGTTSSAYASPGKDFISRTQGELTKTDNPLDVAIAGDGWLAIRTARGIAFTRDGRMRIAESGELQTISGQPILDAGYSPITLDPNAGPPQIFKDGMITQGKQQLGAIGLFSIDETASLARDESSSVVPSKPATPILDFARHGMSQGFLENANVNAVLEMTRLIEATRSFENVSAMGDMLDASQRNAIRILGGAN
jgi:flagellar basal-body rod protein FlgF